MGRDILNQKNVTTNVYVNTNLSAQLPLQVNQTSFNHPITVSMKGLNSLGSANQVIKMNNAGTDLEFADLVTYWSENSGVLTPTTSTNIVRGENGFRIGEASEYVEMNYNSTSNVFSLTHSSSNNIFDYDDDNGYVNWGSVAGARMDFKNYVLIGSSTTYPKGLGVPFGSIDSAYFTSIHSISVKTDGIDLYEYNSNPSSYKTSIRANAAGEVYFTNNKFRVADATITNQLSNGTYNYTLPGSNGTLALTGDILTYTAQSPIQLSGTQFQLTTVPINKGGTNITTYATGDILYASATNVLSKLNIGGLNQVLKVNSSGVPQWKDETVMTATYPLAISGSGDISLGTVPTQKGGTGFTSYAGGQLIYGSTGIGPPNALSLLNIGSTGQVLKVSSGGAPNWENEVSYTAQSPLTVVNNQFQLTTVPYNLGGTGQSSWVQGEILYASANNVLSKLGIGNAGQILQVNTAGTLPEWASFSGASKWSVGDSGLSTEFIYPTTSTQRVAIGYTNNPSDRRLYVNGDTETDQLNCDLIQTQSGKNVFEQYSNGNTLINHNDSPNCTFFTNEVFDFSLRRNGTNTPLGVRIRNDGKTGSSGSNIATDGIYNYLEYFSCNINSHFSPNGGRVIGFTSYLGTQASSYTSSNYPVLATQYGNLYVSTDNDSMVSGDRTGGYYSAYFNSSGVNNVSDARLKKDVETIPNPLEIIRQLRGVYFKWNDGRSEERQTGFIAQEVNEVFKEVVDYDKNPDVYAMRYDKITGLLTEGIKALDKENAELKEENILMKKEIEAIKAHLNLT